MNVLHLMPLQPVDSRHAGVLKSQKIHTYRLIKQSSFDFSRKFQENFWRQIVSVFLPETF